MKALGALPIAACCAVGCSVGCASGGDKGGLMVPFAPAGLTFEQAPRRFALLVGIDDFEDRRFAPLRFAQSDALAFGSALSKAGFEEVRVLTGAAQTSKAAILDALDRLSGRLERPEDVLLVYVSSHGSLGRKPGGPLERFLVARDTRMNLLSQTGISVRALLRTVRGLASRRKVVILATCHSGEGKSQLPEALVQALAGTKGQLPRLTEVSDAMIVLGAAAFGETARESEELSQDIYTHFLLEGLSAGDQDGDGAVTVTEAHDYARERTYIFSGGAQRPVAVSSILGRDPIVLAGKRVRTPLPVLYSYAPAAEGMRVVVDGQTKGTLPGGVAVPPGAHRMELQDQGTGEVLWAGDIALKPGERAELTRLLPERLSFELGVELLSTGLLNHRVRDAFFPWAFGARARARSRNLAVRGVSAELSIGGLGGRGETSAFDEALIQRVQVLQLGAALGYEAALSEGLRLVPAAFAGVLWAWRAIDTEGFKVREALRGYDLGLRFELRWLVRPWLRMGASLGTGGRWARLGTRSLHPILEISLGAALQL